jgi:very-short-patch-repair endonuclease
MLTPLPQCLTGLTAFAGKGGECGRVIKGATSSLQQLLGALRLSYKNRMHPKVSNAEIEVFKALSAKGLTGGMVTQKTIVLKCTIPDFCWLNKRKAVYLDGAQAHSSDKTQHRDEEIVDLLSLQGWEVLRIPYDPPLSEKGLREIVAVIKRFLGEDEE